MRRLQRKACDKCCLSGQQDRSPLDSKLQRSSFVADDRAASKDIHLNPFFALLRFELATTISQNLDRIHYR